MASIPETTIGIDLGKKYSWYCVLSSDGELVSEGRVPTTKRAFETQFCDLEDEPGRPPRAVRRRVALWVGASLAAAAALLIAVVLLKTDGAREPAPESDREAKQQQQPTPTDDKVYTGGSRNDWLFFRVVKEARPAELFDDPVITLETEAQRGFGVLCLLPWRPGETLGSVAERMVQKEILTPPKTGLLPVALSAEITAPSGRVYEGRLAFPENPSMTIMSVMNGGPTFKARKAFWTLRLSQILVRTHAPLPYFAVLPDGKGGWITDQRRAYDRIPGYRKLPQDMTDLRWERFFPDELGRYTVKFQLHTLPAQKKYGWPEFEKPLTADVSFPVTGVTGKWSKSENGLSFRLAAPRKVWRKGESVPIALQIRNDADAPRKYNFMGTTGAEIPRPYHFQLFLDGKTEPASFRLQEHGGFTFFGEYGFTRHPPPAGHDAHRRLSARVLALR